MIEAGRPASAEPGRQSRRNLDRGLLERDDGPPLILVHGATADHTTFRVVGPRFANAFTSTPSTGAAGVRPATREPYAIEREFEDVAAVADVLAARPGWRSLSSATRTVVGARSARPS